MAIYICADPNFFSAAAAQKLNKTVEQYNDFIIENWNSLINADDYVVLLGNVGGGNPIEMKAIMSQLIGTKMILDYDPRRGNTRLSKKQWLEAGVQTYRFHSSVTGKIKGVEQRARILCWNDPLCRKENYCAAPGSTIETNKLFESNTLNLSIEKWNYAPVPYLQVPKLINSAIIMEGVPNEE